MISLMNGEHGGNRMKYDESEAYSWLKGVRTDEELLATGPV